MSDSDVLVRPPMILIANDQEWSARSLESILGPSGYAVLRAYTGRQALDLARTTQPDLLILDERMPDIRGTEVCRILREDDRFGEHVPIIITTADSVDRAQRLAAYTAGAWEFIEQPFDAEALLLRIATFIRAKRQVDVVRDESLLDPATGLYNMRGLARRAREVAADAYRHRAPLACVVLAADALPSAYSDKVMDELIEQVVSHLGTVIRRSGRASDVVGRLGHAEFGIIAPSTESDGAVRLVERLQETLEAAPLEVSGQERPLRVRAGYYAVPDFAESSVDALAMLLRAATALRHLREEESGGAIRSYDEVPVRLAR